MKPVIQFVSDNTPSLFISGVVLCTAASVLLYTVAYLHI